MYVCTYVHAYINRKKCEHTTPNGIKFCLTPAKGVLYNRIVYYQVGSSALVNVYWFSSNEIQTSHKSLLLRYTNVFVELGPNLAFILWYVKYIF